MRRISTDQLPRWFSIDKYYGTSKLTLAAWLDNLEWRYDLRSLRNKSLEAMREQLDEHFSTFDSLAVHWGQYAKGEQESTEFAIPDECDYPALETATVSSISVSYIANYIAYANHADGNLNKKLAELAEILWQSESQPSVFDDMIEGEDGQFYSQPIDIADRQTKVDTTDLSEQFIRMIESLGGPKSNDRLHVEVDLGAPDKIILEDFRTWLKGARQVFSIDSKNYFTESMCGDWSDFGVLPFLDLSLWARANALEITDEVMGSALFPDEIDVDISERMRKVVRPKANWLMNPSIISAIKTQVLRPK